MKRIEAEGKLFDWAKDSIDWCKKEYGKENIVSAYMHRDETTPHIHVSLVPIVTGERRKAKLEENSTKKKYKKKNPNNARLCADDVMARDKLEHYQDSYAEAMAKYGLKRGIRGSEAKHISIPQFYRDTKLEIEMLKEDIEELTLQKDEVKYSIRGLYDIKDEAREKFYKMDEYVKGKSKELEMLETKLNKVKQENIPYAFKEDYMLMKDFFPSHVELITIAKQCLNMGFSKDFIKQLLYEKEKIYSGTLNSPEKKKIYKVENADIKIVRGSESKELKLIINKIEIGNWFKQIEHKKSIPNNIKPKGIKL